MVRGRAKLCTCLVNVLLNLPGCHLQILDTIYDSYPVRTSMVG